MKFLKIPYNNGTGFRLINLDEIQSIDVNSSSGTCQIYFKTKEKLILAGPEAHILLDRISEYNFLTKFYLSLGCAERDGDDN